MPWDESLPVRWADSVLPPAGDRRRQSGGIIGQAQCPASPTMVTSRRPATGAARSNGLPPRHRKVGDLKCAIVLHLAQLLQNTQNFESVKPEPAHPTENRWMILLVLFLPGLVYFDCPGLFWILTLGHCSVYMLLGSCFYTYRHRQTHTHKERLM